MSIATEQPKNKALRNHELIQYIAINNGQYIFIHK